MNIEEKRNQLNLELRMLLAVIDLIDGVERKYPDYNENDKMSEEEFLDQQLLLVTDARERLVKIFKD